MNDEQASPADLETTKADLLALVSLEVQKFLDMSKATPACVANLRELAHLSAAVLRLEPVTVHEAGREQSDWSRLSADELRTFGRLLAKARGQNTGAKPGSA